MVPKGTVIYREGDPSTEVFIVQDGSVQLYTRVKGEVLCLALLGPGDFFGELGVIEDQAHSTSAEALTDTVIVTLDKDIFQKILSENPEIGFRLIRILCRRLREANDRVLKVMSHDEQVRVAEELINFGAKADHDDRESPASDRLIVASKAGMVQSRVDAVVDRLIGLGLVQENLQGQLSVLDVKALKDFIEYCEMKKEYDPLSPKDLAQAAGMTLEEAEQLIERVTRRRLPNIHKQDPGQNPLTPIQRYLQYKLRFEFKPSADGATEGAGDDHEGAL